MIIALHLVLAGLARADLIAPYQIEILQRFKASLYNNITLFNADGVEAGTADPFVYVEMGSGTLPVAYYHFPIREDRVAAFAEALTLPPGLALTPVRVVTGTSPRHYLTVTTYESGGERNGRRAEWTTYVRTDGDERPRVLMLETAMSTPSLDPVRIHAPPAARFLYERQGSRLVTDIVSGSSAFSASVPLPPGLPRTKLLDRQWGAASDVVYWRNGIADLQAVNGLIANRPVTRVPPANVQVSNGSPWALYCEAHPEWVLLFEERIDVAVRPWVNADDPTVPLDPGFRELLLETKATEFAALERARADAVTHRQAEPLADFVLEDFPPSIFINFEIDPDRRHDFARAIPLPEGFSLAPIEPYRGLGNRYFLNLNIYLAAGLAPGLRAEWSVYVTRDGDPAPRFMIVETQTSGASLDPVNRVTLPADIFEYELEGDILSVNIQAPHTTFQSRIRLPETPAYRPLTLDWAECNNLVYWINGVADKVYYNDSAYASVALVPTRNVTLLDGTRWAPYVHLDHVFLYDVPQPLVVSPWTNLDQLQQAAPGRRPLPRALRQSGTPRKSPSGSTGSSRQRRQGPAQQ